MSYVIYFRDCLLSLLYILELCLSGTTSLTSLDSRTSNTYPLGVLNIQ